MGLFGKKVKVDPAELTAMHAELETLRQRLEVAETSRQTLEARVITLNEMTDALRARTHELDDMTQRIAEVDVIKRQMAQLDVVNAKLLSLESLNGKLAELADRVIASSLDAKTAKDQAVTLNERMSNLSREFANQLTELSNELDQLASRPAPAPVVVTEQVVSDEMIEQLHEGQVRLANEQARYEIAFRHDLAVLADQVRRTHN